MAASTPGLGSFVDGGWKGQILHFVSTRAATQLISSFCMVRSGCPGFVYSGTSPYIVSFIIHAKNALFYDVSIILNERISLASYSRAKVVGIYVVLPRPLLVLLCAIRCYYLIAVSTVVPS